MPTSPLRYSDVTDMGRKIGAGVGVGRTRFKLSVEDRKGTSLGSVTESKWRLLTPSCVFAKCSRSGGLVDLVEGVG